MFTVKRKHILCDLTYIQKKQQKTRQYIDFFLIKLILEHLNKMCCKTSNFMHNYLILFKLNLQLSLQGNKMLFENDQIIIIIIIKDNQNHPP